MSRKIFLYKDNSEDRDCVVYIKNKPMRFECDHYFGGVNLQGACYSKGFKDIEYKDIKTIITEAEFQALIEFDKDIHELGYGIKKNDEKYNKGVELCKNIQYVYDKLNSKENQELFKKIIAEETEYLMKKYSLDNEDVEQIFDEYGLEYRDRGVVGYVFDSVEDLAHEEAYQLGYVNNDSIQSKYFNYEKFGKDLLEEDQYYELSDGRVVVLCY